MTWTFGGLPEFDECVHSQNTSVCRWYAEGDDDQHWKDENNSYKHKAWHWFHALSMIDLQRKSYWRRRTQKMPLPQLSHFQHDVLDDLIQHLHIIKPHNISSQISLKIFPSISWWFLTSSDVNCQCLHKQWFVERSLPPSKSGSVHIDIHATRNHTSYSKTIAKHFERSGC